MGNLYSTHLMKGINKSVPSLHNQKWILTQHPKEKFNFSTDATLVKEIIDLETVSEDMVVVEVLALSVDAFIRTMLDNTDNHAHGSSGLGKVIPAIGYGKVIKGNAKFKDGALVTGLLGATKYSIQNNIGLSPVSVLPGTKPTDVLGVLGISGIAAYVGMFLASPKCPQKGETVVVSAAAGGAGNIAAQIAKLCGARVIGIAGGELKQKFLLEELKLDGCIDYKSTTKTITEQLEETCPNGIDFFFDNVGGNILDEVLQKINLHSRVVICGAISQYDSGNINNKHLIRGPSHYIKLAEMSSTMTGFNMMHYSQFFFKAFFYLAWHYLRGNIRSHQHIEYGIEVFGECLENLFSGVNCGRLIVDLQEKK